MWVIEVKNMGPFIVESDLKGNSLFERENAKIAHNLKRLYEGTKPATLKRYGETDDRKDELILLRKQPHNPNRLRKIRIRPETNIIMINSRLNWGVSSLLNSQMPV